MLPKPPLPPARFQFRISTQLLCDQRHHVPLAAMLLPVTVYFYRLSYPATHLAKRLLLVSLHPVVPCRPVSGLHLEFPDQSDCDWRFAHQQIRCGNRPALDSHEGRPADGEIFTHFSKDSPPYFSPKVSQKVESFPCRPTLN